MTSQQYSPREGGTETEQETVQQQAPEGKNKLSSRKSASAFRTISEVAEDLDVQQHVLRFWETKFSQIRPLKRGGGRRYYRPEDLELLQTIHHLLYTEGYTIKGVQKLLKEQGKNQIVQNNKPELASNMPGSVTRRGDSQPQIQAQGLSPKNRALLEGTLGDLKAMRRVLVSGE